MTNVLTIFVFFKLKMHQNPPRTPLGELTTLPGPLAGWGGEYTIPILTLNCCSFPVSAHVSVPAASLLLLQLFGTPFLWPFVVVAALTVFERN